MAARRVDLGAGQLELFADVSARADTANGNGHRPTVAELGFRKEASSGPERLLRELIRRGLAQEHYLAAAALVRALDAEARKVPA